MGDKVSQQHQVWRVIGGRWGSLGGRWGSLEVAHRLVGDLQQVQHHGVSPHVLQKPLLLHTTLFIEVTQLAETQQDLHGRQTR